MEIQKIIENVTKFIKDPNSINYTPVNKLTIQNTEKVISTIDKLANKSKDYISNFVKDETGKELEPKKTIAFIITLTSLSGGLTLVTAKEKIPGPQNTATSISQEVNKIGPLTETTQTQNISFVLEDPVLVEHLTQANYDNGINQIKGIIIKYNIPKDLLFIIRLPYKYSGSKYDPWATDIVNKRMDFYLSKPPKPNYVLPQLIADGKSNKEFQGNQTWEELLKNANKKDHQAKFKVQANENNSLTIECEATNPDILKNNNLNLVAISYQDWVNLLGTSPKGETTYRNVVNKFHLEPEGVRVKFDKNTGKITKTISLENISEEIFEQSGLILALQDMSNKSVKAVGLLHFAKLHGIEKPTVGNWNDYPDHNYDASGKLIDKKYILQTGKQEMVFSLENTDEITKVAMGIKQDSNDNKYFHIEGYKIYDDVKDNIKSVKFNKKTSNIEIDFIRPISNKEKLKIFSYIVDFTLDNYNKNEEFGFQLKDINIRKGNNIPYLDFNDLLKGSCNQPVVEKNPYDLTDDASVNDEDMKKFLPEFGSESKDKTFEPKFDFNKDLKINMEDFIMLLREIKRQKALEEIVEKQNSNIIELKIGQPTPNDIQRKISIEQKFKEQQIKNIKDQISKIVKENLTHKTPTAV